MTRRLPYMSAACSKYECMHAVSMLHAVRHFCKCRSVVNFCIMLSLLSFDTFTVTSQIEKGFCRNFPLVSAVIF